MANAIATYALVPGAFDILYEHLSNLVCNLEIEPNALLTFGLTSLTASQVLQRLPPNYQVKFPFIASILDDEMSLALSSNIIGVIFAKHVTDYFSESPLNWSEATMIEATRFISKIAHHGLIALFEKENLRSS
jgi:hypothetical protein